jgi:hypothetical protein
MKINLAPISATSNIVTFFGKYISSDNDALYSGEFFCPDGIRAAIRRNQVLITVVDNRIIGCLRFYRRKTQKIISLYQFAIDENYRGQGVLKQMLDAINDVPIEVLCPARSKFNKYYQKTGWKFMKQAEKLNHWIL